MAGITRETPFSLMITPNNWFNLGWLEAVLGSQGCSGRQWNDRDNPVRDDDIDAYQDGYTLGRESNFDLTELFETMLDRKVLTISTKG